MTSTDTPIRTLQTEAIEHGVRVAVGFDHEGEALTFRFSLNRETSRAFARAILAAGGDAAERTFTNPATKETARG